MAKEPTKDEVLKRVEAARDQLDKIPTPKIKGQISGFMNFVRQQGVVGLAVGLSIGTAATVMVKSIVDEIINPVIGAVLPGGSKLSSKFICLTESSGECINKLSWGVVLSNLISFLAVAAVIYFVVVGLKLDKLDKKKED